MTSQAPNSSEVTPRSRTTLTRPQKQNTAFNAPVHRPSPPTIQNTDRVESTPMAGRKKNSHGKKVKTSIEEMQSVFTISPEGTRRRINNKRIGKGNNSAGRNGKPKCELCRSRRRKCEYKDPGSLCRLCTERGVAECLKVYGSKTETRLRAPVTPDTACLSSQDEHVLHHAYSGGSPRPAFTKTFLAFAKWYTLSIQSGSLRNAMLAYACKWYNPPSPSNLAWLEHYADLSGKALRKKSEETIDEADFFAACLLAISHSLFGRKHSTEIHIRGSASVLWILFQKNGGRKQFLESLGSEVSPIFFFLYDIVFGDLCYLPLAPKESLERIAHVGAIGGIVSYSEREGYHEELGLCPPQTHFTKWPTFLTIWIHYQTLLRAFDVTRDPAMMNYVLSPAVGSLIREIKSDVESPHMRAAMTHIRQILFGPERQGSGSKATRLRIVLLLHHSCCLLLSILTEGHYRQNSTSWARLVWDLIRGSREHDLKPLPFVSRPTSTLQAVFPDDILIRVIPIIAALDAGIVNPGVGTPTGSEILSANDSKRDKMPPNYHCTCANQLWEFVSSGERLCGRREIGYADVVGWEFHWFRRDGG